MCRIWSPRGVETGTLFSKEGHPGGRSDLLGRQEPLIITCLIIFLSSHTEPRQEAGPVMALKGGEHDDPCPEYGVDPASGGKMPLGVEEGADSAARARHRAGQADQWRAEGGIDRQPHEPRRYQGTTASTKAACQRRTRDPSSGFYRFHKHCEGSHTTGAHPVRVWWPTHQTVLLARQRPGGGGV